MAHIHYMTIRRYYHSFWVWITLIQIIQLNNRIVLHSSSNNLQTNQSSLITNTMISNHHLITHSKISKPLVPLEMNSSYSNSNSITLLPHIRLRIFRVIWWLKECFLKLNRLCKTKLWRNKDHRVIAWEVMLWILLNRIQEPL